MRTIDADKVIEKLKEHKRMFCKNRVEFIALSDKDKARVDEIDTCIAELVNAEEVPRAQLGTNLAEVGTDCISRQAAIDGKICIQRANGVEIYDDYVVPVEYLEQLPPAQPNVHDLAKDADCISRQAAITALSNEIVKRRLLDEMYDGCIDEFQTEEILKKLPPAQPEIVPCDYVKACKEATRNSPIDVYVYRNALAELKELGYVLVDMREVTT